MHLSVAVRIPQMSMTINPLGDLRLDRLNQQRLRAVSKDLRQHVFRFHGWKMDRRRGNFLHGGVLLELNGFSKTIHSKYAALFNLQSTTFCYISRRS